MSNLHNSITPERIKGSGEKKPFQSWRKVLHEVIFEAETFGGKFFDVALLIAILFSVFMVMLESVESLRLVHGKAFLVTEWVFTVLFTIEYILRIISIGKPMKYIFSFFGIVDLLSILPTYVSIFVVGAPSLIIIRTLRLLRVFRVLKLVRFLKEAHVLQEAMRASRAKITVFLFAVLTIVVIMGTLMYMIEPPEAGFTSIPRSIYWAIVTLTTVGYGDIAPVTVLGQSLASVIMIIGYGVIAVPTGIVGVELAKVEPAAISTNTQACSECSKEGHDDDADFCKHCGTEL